ncbi:hypothetical protein BASA81_001767 [Batrachochytrium salamandrivorans]|nr:hypothetical protein BASA81_001767 [Batrachochytrium salamandrivorans]
MLPPSVAAVAAAGVDVGVATGALATSAAEVVTSAAALAATSTAAEIAAVAAQLSPNPQDQATAYSPKLSKLIKKFDGYLPETKLESMGLGTMRAMFGSMWLIGILSTIVIIMLAALNGSVEQLDVGTISTLSASSGLRRGVYVIEGLFRTLATVGALFLLIAFPQRTIRNASVNANVSFKLPSTDMLILMLVLFAMCISPGFSVYGVVLFWMDFALLTEDLEASIYVDGSKLSEDEVSRISFDVPSLMYVFEQSGGWLYSHVSLATCLVLLYLFPILWFKIQQAAKHPVPHINSLGETSSEMGDDFRSRTDSTRSLNDELSIPLDDDTEEPVSNEYFSEVRQRVKNTYLDTKVKMRVTCAEWDFVFVLLVYFAILLTLGFGLDVNMSIVPLVHLITLLRFCVESDPTDFMPANFTFVEEVNSTNSDGQEVRSNLTVNWVVRSLQITNTSAICSPDQVDSVLFLRVIALSLAGFLELCLIFYIYRISAQTKMFLVGQNYYTFRKEILEYQFFRALYTLASGFILLIGILAASLGSLDDAYVKNIRLDLVLSDSGNIDLDVGVYLDPLYQVGVSFGTVGYGSVYCMFVVFLGWICYASLPVDSFGLTGWFCPVQLGDERRKHLIMLYSNSDYLALVPEESTVHELLELQQHESVPITLSSAFANLTKSRTRTQLQNQIAGNFLCLETEILLFHFMHLSYVLANTKKVPGAVIKRMLSLDEQQQFVENVHFTMHAHIIDTVTDTHAFVFASDDRIVVAFRGSVSMINWRTDFDFAEVICPFATQVDQPDISVLGEGNMVRAKRVSENTKPVVHRGFVLAYETVRERVLAKVRELREDNPERSAVFVTGHSLGGGLGILCTLDLAVTLKLGPDSLTLTTWGSPKIGNFAFIARFFRVCPAARRFAMVDDVITKLPPSKFLSKLTLGGWWHVGTEILLNSTGQCLIRPTDLERFMFQRTVGNASAHLRMSYATAIMIWIVRSQPDFKADWWISVLTLFNKNRDKRLRKVPANIRQVLYESLQKPGVVYKVDSRTVRDMLCTTEVEEEQVGEMITELLVAYRMGNSKGFDSLFAKLQSLRQHRKIFNPTGVSPTTTSTASEDEGEQEQLISNAESVV